MRAPTLLLLALTFIFAAAACDDAASSDGDGGGGSGSGGSGAGGSGAGGSGAVTCNDQSAVAPVGNCFYSDMGFCAEWHGANAGDPAQWADACSGADKVWTSGQPCSSTDSLGTCKDTSGSLTVINTYYAGGIVSDTAFGETLCLDADSPTFECATWTAP